MKCSLIIFSCSAGISGLNNFNLTATEPRCNVFIITSTIERVLLGNYEQGRQLVVFALIQDMEGM